MRKYVIIAVVAAIVLAATGFYFKGKKPEYTYRTVKVERGTIVSSVAPPAISPP